MQAKATAKMLRVSPRKVRLLLDEVRGKKVDDALTLLRFSGKPVARDVAKVVKSAAANAETNFNLDPTELYIVRVTADKGRTLKRYRPKARGRVGPILKRSSHLTVVVAERG